MIVECLERVTDLGPQLFTGREDSTRPERVSRRYSLVRRFYVPVQMFPCQPVWGTHALNIQRSTEL
jgi:hypothetical protein